MFNIFGSKPKKILLIIDPQNDFSEKKLDVRDNNGPLVVPGSSKDYERIAKLIEADTFNEIHISLDTHTAKHIGHKGFYKPAAELNDIQGCHFWEEKFTPVDASLNEYVKNYANKQKEARNTSGFYCIWDTHCLEDSSGHEIVKEITDALDKQSKAKVRYHIKGQNELTEMYSIFSAAVQPNDVEGSVGDFKYNGTKRDDGDYDRREGVESYEKAKDSLNLNTSMNTELLANLFGANNEIYVCGQAKTHCVKDSVLDMIKYAKDENNVGKTQQIHLLKNCTSVIPSFQDDIEDILTASGGKIVEESGGKIVIVEESDREIVTGDDLLGTEQQSAAVSQIDGGKRRTKKQKKSKKKKTRKSRKTRKNKKSRKH